MDPWVKSVILSIVAALGAAIFKNRVDQYFESTKAYLEGKFDSLSDRNDKAEASLEKLGKEVHAINTKMAVVISEQGHIKKRLDMDPSVSGLDS